MNKPRFLYNPPYVQTVLDMMMVFPSMYRSEPQCANNLFLSTGSVEVVDRKIRETRGWVVGEGDTLIDRTAVSILGTKRDNWAKFEKPYKETAHGRYYDFPIFYSWGDDSLFRYENWTRRPKNQNSHGGWGGDIFNAFLNDEVDLPEDWKAAMDHFCYHLLRISQTAYISTRYGYYLQHGGGREYWQGRFQEDCEVLPRLWAAATEIQNKLRPPQPPGPPPVDYKKITEDFVKKTERVIMARLRKAGAKEFDSPRKA